VNRDDSEPGAAPRRPGVLRWLWYALTGRLPSTYRAWVLHDLSKLMVPLVPVDAALLAMLPGPMWLRANAVVLGSVIGLLFSFVFLEESTEHRAQRFGLPPGAVQGAREERRASRDLARAARDFDRTIRLRRFRR
jgi:hypothetical protein